ncbi:hypothetical protein IQ235_18160 [Oscillatoriales cyanobacterium LEGE 11467]|uniref:Uncharacterized protein n=1 Tax=Zarconia navalis LEGE 11467 TaxID=1828826 RepID=A0A928W2E6_9CYAN|nr:hypothetical protein [Zarconia navalis LEGE 11467]
MPLGQFLEDLIHQLAPQSYTNLPETIGTKVSKLLDILRQKRCLLVLDDVESILQKHTPQKIIKNGLTEQYFPDSQIYFELFRQLGEGRHQSCVVLTSRAEPKYIQLLAGNNSGIRSLPIRGLQVTEIQQMLSEKGIFGKKPAQWSRLVDYYGGNPLILNIVATTIKRLFNGSIADFFRYNTMIFNEIHEVLDRQFEDFSALEKDVMRVLATQETPFSFADLRSQISPSISTVILLESVRLLQARQIIEKITDRFSLSPLLRDYMQKRCLSAR